MKYQNAQMGNLQSADHIGLTAKPLSWLKLSLCFIRRASFTFLLKQSSSWSRTKVFSQSMFYEVVDGHGRLPLSLLCVRL